jgi:hypothetical protein
MRQQLIKFFNKLIVQYFVAEIGKNPQNDVISKKLRFGIHNQIWTVFIYFLYYYFKEKVFYLFIYLFFVYFYSYYYYIYFL